MKNEDISKNFPVDIFKRGVKVFFGEYECLKKALNKDGVKGDFEEAKELMERSAGVTFTLNTDDVIIWLRNKPNGNGDRAVLAHEIFHAVSFLLRSVGIGHTPDTEEIYAYTFENLYFRITSWICS